MVERASVPVGETARLLVQSGLADQDLVLEIYRGGQRVESRRLDSDQGVHIVEIPIGKRAAWWLWSPAYRSARSPADEPDRLGLCPLG